MKIRTKELKQIFEKIKPGLAKKDIIEQAKNITFDGKFIFTYNENIGVFFPFETDFICSVPAQELMKIVSDISDEKIDIELSETVLRLTGKNVKAELNILSDINCSDVIVNQDIKFYSLPEDFQQGITLCSFAASKDINSKFNGIFITENNIFGSDDLRISHFEMKSKMKKPLLIPLSSVLALKEFELKKYGFDDGLVYFKDSDDVLFCTRLLMKDYSNLIFHFEFEGKEIIFPEEIKELVGKAEILSEGDFDIDLKILVKIKDGKLFCIGENEIGNISAYTEIEKDENLEFLINPIFFKGILSETNIAKIGNDRILFQTEKFKHLVSLYCKED